MVPRILRVTRRNAAFQVLESLATNRARRHRAGQFLLEGVVPITAALTSGWGFDALLYEDGVRRSAWAEDVLARAGAPVQYALGRDLLAALSGKEDASELLALVRMPPDDAARIPVRPDLLAAVLDSPASPGNLGTIIRSADAFGVHGILVTGHAADPYDPGALTASRGAIFRVPVVRVASPAAVRAWVLAVRRRLGHCQVIGADEKGGLSLYRQDLRPATLIVLGNEARGLSRAFQDLCDTLVRIPMTGTVTSLNVGVAASILFYEAGRQRAGGRP